MATGGRQARDMSAGTVGGREPGEHNIEDVFHVRALSRGLRLLALFAVDSPEWTLNELSRTTGLHKATTYRMTRTMEAEGFLVFDPAAGTYHLGPAMIPLSFLATSQSELVRLARPYLEELADATGETGNLAVAVEGSIVVIGQVLTSHPFKPSLPLGRVMNDLANAHKKLLIAFGPEDAKARALAVPQPRLTPNTVIDPVKVAAELALVAVEGVAYDLEEHGVGICSVAAPIRDSSGEVRATFAVVAPRERFGPQEMKSHAEIVKRVAAAFSEGLGYTGG